MGDAQYLNHKLECPSCGTIRMRIPDDVQPDSPITCEDCGRQLGMWDELQTDFERQGGARGIFRIDKGRIRKVG